MSTNPSMIKLMTSTLTMNSKEIAELVGSAHSDVRRSIARLVKRGAILVPATAVVDEISNLGLTIKREVDVFTHEHKRDTFVVVAQLSPEFTASAIQCLN